MLALADEKFRVGTATKLDVEQAKTVLEQTRSLIPAFEIEQGQANDTLCTLLGMPPRDLAAELGPGPGPNDTPMPKTPDWVAAGIPADLLRQRPDVRSAERQIAAQSAQIGVAEAELYPSFYINGTIGYESQDLSDAVRVAEFHGQRSCRTFAGTFLNYGRILNNVRLQQARTLELIASYQNTVLTAGRETQTALRSFHKTREQADDLSRAVTAAVGGERSSASSSTARAPCRSTRCSTWKRRKCNSRINWRWPEGTSRCNLIEVYRAVGGGWEMRLERRAGGAWRASTGRPGDRAVAAARGDA